MGPENGAETNKMAADSLAWFMNVSSSVLIVFVNKVLMDPTWGCKFVFATSLCSLHFFSSAATVWTTEAIGFGTPAKLPWKDTIIFSLVASVSIAALNLSLLVNSVGFYQISKLLIIPFVCLVEFFMMGRRFSLHSVIAIVAVVIGVGIVTITDLGMNAMNTTGLIIAMVSIVSSGMQQILCGHVQRKFKLTSNQLLSNTAPVQGVMLLFVGPFIDLSLSNKWIFNYIWTGSSIQWLIFSCSVAVLVNISQFMCLGRFSAVTFQVLGHTKTILVLLVGWMFLGDVITQRKLLGMGMAVAGMVAYGYSTMSPPKKEVQMAKDMPNINVVPREADSSVSRPLLGDR